MSESGEQFLHRKDTKLHITGPIEYEQARKRRVGEPVSQRPADKIASWLGVIERTHVGHKDDLRVIERIRQYYRREYVIKSENIPQSYWNLQGEIAVAEGRKQDLINSGVLIEETTVRDQNGLDVLKRAYTFPEEVKEQAARIVVSNQEQSLDKWVDYLTSGDASYPMWAKYWAFRSVVKMGKLEKTEDGKARFAAREKNTVASFPLLNPRALAKTIGAMSARLEAKGKPKGQQSTQNLSATLPDDEYQKLLSTEDFSKLYAQFLAEIPEYSTHGLEETRGKWVKYDQGAYPKPLSASLEGHPLEWCTADVDTARTQLKAGDFYVYYSIDEGGNPTIPRLAIRMEGAKIAEPPRGIAPNQNLDPYIADVLEKKLEEFGEEGKSSKKRTADMKRLTEIEKKVQGKQDLNSQDLRFLYEIDSTIEGFGYDRDPRIEELRSPRNSEEDMPIIFGCDRSQIARSIKEIRPDTRSYVGKLEPGIFYILSRQNIEHVYTSFPEGKIRIEDLGIGSRSKKQLREDLRQANIKRFPQTDDRIKNPDFTTLPNPEIIKTVRLKVQDLGLENGATTDEVYVRADELGLDLCPEEVGVYQRLKDINQPLDERYFIAMKQIIDRDGLPVVFSLARLASGLWLDYRWARPNDRWGPEDQLVFAVRKPEPLKP